MRTSIPHTAKWIMTATVIALLGLAWTAQPAFSQSGPKNLVSPTYRRSTAPAAVAQGLTKKEVNRLAATAETREDHLKLAGYYEDQADKLDAQATGYEEAAATYRSGPNVKNLIAPTTAGRYEFFAKRSREEARSNRALATSHEQMAALAPFGK